MITTTYTYPSGREITLEVTHYDRIEHFQRRVTVALNRIHLRFWPQDNHEELIPMMLVVLEDYFQYVPEHGTLRWGISIDGNLVLKHETYKNKELKFAAPHLYFKEFDLNV